MTRSRKLRFQICLFVFPIVFIAFVFQGCVIHSHSHPSSRYKTNSYSNATYQRLPSNNAQTRQPAPVFVTKLPPKERHSSYTHNPPPHARAHEVAKGKPFTENNHPSSNGKDHKINNGKPHKEIDHLSNTDHNHQRGSGKPEKGPDHPSQRAQDNKGRAKIKEKPLWGDELAENKIQTSKDQGQKSKSRHFANKDQTSPEIEESLIEPWTHDQSSSVKKKIKEKSDDKGSEDRNIDKQKIAGYQDKKNSEKHSSSSHDKKTQKAHSKSDHGKSADKAKGKIEDQNKTEKETVSTATDTHAKPVPDTVTLQPVTTTASFAPSMFDQDQRIIIQSYYRKSGHPKHEKGRNKHSKKSKGNSNRTLAKNDILTQPVISLPKSLESQLPPTAPNTKRVLFNRQVLLLEENTNRILDVINLNN